MAAPVSVVWWNPKKIFVAALLGSALLFILSIFSLLMISDKQNSQLIDYELSLLLKSHQQPLLNRQFREVSEAVGTADHPWSIDIQDTTRGGNKFSFASQGMGSPNICVAKQYFSYSVQLCRTRVFPWESVVLLSALYAAILVLMFMALSRSSARLLNSFREFFIASNLLHPEPLTFSKAWSFANNMAERFRFLQEQAREFGRAQAAEQIATQLAHDIRSPLSALNLLSSTLSDISEDKRSMLMQVSKRINDIANSLLQDRANTASKPNGLGSAYEQVELRSIVSAIVKEKNIELVEKSSIQIQFQNDKSDRYARVDATEFGRVLSNLLNNSLEAIAPNSGKVTVDLETQGSAHRITITDDGKGMSSEALNSFGKFSISVGKSKGLSGYGLGALHARKFVEGAGGELHVRSEVNRGTVITLILPSSN